MPIFRSVGTVYPLGSRRAWLHASFVDAPHKAIEGKPHGDIINLTDHRAGRSRQAQLDLLGELGPDRIVGELEALRPSKPAQVPLPYLIMPAHHDVRPKDVFARRLHATLAAAAEQGPMDFADLLLSPRVGARTDRWRWWPKSCTARPFPLAILRGFRWRMVARTAIATLTYPFARVGRLRRPLWGRASTVVRPGRNDMKKAWFKAIRVGIHTCEILS